MERKYKPTKTWLILCDDTSGYYLKVRAKVAGTMLEHRCELDVSEFDALKKKMKEPDEIRHDGML